MTLLTTQSGMATCQREASLPMIHRFAVWLPANQREIRAIVVGMALNAVFAGSFCPYPDRMHTAVLRQTIADFRVAIQTFEFRAAGAQVMAFRATQDSRKGLMCFRQRTRRNLGAGWSSAQGKHEKEKDRKHGREC